MTNKERCFLGYVAGLIDGEGCINIIKVHRKVKFATPNFKGANDCLSYRASIMINMVDALALAILKDKFSKSHLYCYLNKTQENRKPQWHWCIYDNHCWDFLKMIKPYLINKQEQAQILLTFLAIKRRANIHKQYTQSYWERLNNLHQRLMTLRQTELNAVNSAEILNRMDLRQYRAKHEDCERLREGVTTMLNKYKAISTAEKEIV